MPTKQTTTEKQTRPPADGPREDTRAFVERKLNELEAMITNHIERLKAEPLPAAAVAQLDPFKERQRKREAQRAGLEPVLRIFNDTHSLDLVNLITFKLIQDRYNGDSTPIEQFILNLVHLYEWAEEEGKGVSLSNIDREVENLRERLPELIEEAHYNAARHPLPEVKNTDAA